MRTAVCQFLCSLALFGSLIVSQIAHAVPAEWKLTTLDGVAVPDPTPGKNLQFVLFWASWCGICKEKMKGPMLEWEKTRPDLGLLTVNIDREAAKGKHSAEKEKITLPVYREENRDLRKKLGVFAAPHWIVYRRENATAPWVLVDSQAGWDDAKIAKAIALPVAKDIAKDAANPLAKPVVKEPVKPVVKATAKSG